jgi:hypothetical protein
MSFYTMIPTNPADNFDWNTTKPLRRFLFTH